MKFAYCLIVFILFGLTTTTSRAEIELKTNKVTTSDVLSSTKIFLDATQSVLVQNGASLQQARESIETLPTADLKGINGYKNSKVWIVLSIKNSSDITDFFVRYSYPSMQYIEAIVFDEDGGPQSRFISGKLVPFEQRPVKDTDYLFPLKIENGKSLTVVMSFQSTGSMQLPIEILSANRVHEWTQTKYLFYGLYYGAIFLIFIYTIFLSLTLKTKLYGAYLFYLVSVVFAQMGLHGISYQYIWPNLYQWNKVSTIFFVGLMFCSLSIFSTIALDLKKNHKCFYRMMLALSVVSGLVSLSALFAYGNWVIKLTGMITSILPLIIIPPGVVAWRNGHKFAPYYLVAVFFYIIGASLYGLKDSGALAPGFITENGILIGSLIEISIFSFGIARHLQGVQRRADEIKMELEKTKIINEMASQVSHDIRSPLSALAMLLGCVPELSEEKRMLVRLAVNRITDIANSLLEKSKKQQTEILDKNESPILETTLMATLVESVMAEKKMEIQGNHRVLLKTELNESRNLFANVNSMELKRVLSNTINNSVEAFENSKDGLIELSIGSDATSVILKIKDNGKGIPKHILERLGQQGVSYGKEGTFSGSGLGVYHAKKTIESFGGKYNVESIEGIGTTVTMVLPKI